MLPFYDLKHVITSFGVFHFTMTTQTIYKSEIEKHKIKKLKHCQVYIKNFQVKFL